jgi:hypothetical protein
MINIWQIFLVETTLLQLAVNKKTGRAREIRAAGTK